MTPQALPPDEIQAVLRRALNQQPEPHQMCAEIDSALSHLRINLNASDFLKELVRTISEPPDRPNDPSRMMFLTWLIEFDGRTCSDPGGWAAGTEPGTPARRSKIHELLGLDTELRKRVDGILAPPDVNRGFCVDHVEWYDHERRTETRHYAQSLETYLTEHGWSPQNLLLVRQAAEYVIGNLGDPRWTVDPTSTRQFVGRGLVVGYVQSGKTTMMNYTIATAVDVGYRIVIVLAGLTDLLRRQTQRRLDKEVVGRDVLLQDPEVSQADGYKYQADWPSFITHGRPRPGVTPREMERLTTQRKDYTRPIGNAFPPSWVRDASSCKIIVIKKNKSRLEKLIGGIRSGISEADRRRLSVLILDDESDQATINTVNPRITGERKGINLQLRELLKVLPNAQYVGVTATPAANCFTDPSDLNDTYPRHFILPLSRPDGYMGIMDFHDLDDELVPIPADRPQPNKYLHVRDITQPRGGDDQDIQSALDAFVLSGALKLYRRRSGAFRGRHHTLFYSDSTFIKDMSDARERIQELWNTSAYSSTTGIARLRRLYEEDLHGRSDKKEDSKHFPESFEDLLPDIAEAVHKIDEPFDGSGAVLVVNGTQDSADIDFQIVEVWKIVVGGMKLSRGYTIEGLTVTYFRRKSTNEAALMQMGRWFGYRAGYRDLVRLWISRHEPAKPLPIDVYDFFESVCIDEETLRRKFRQWYETRNPDGSRVTPIQIRPLISTVNPRLSPVAKNQMWNASLISQTFTGVLDAPYFDVSSDSLRKNEQLWQELFQECALEAGQRDHTNRLYWVRDVTHQRMTSLLKSVERPTVKHRSLENLRLFDAFLVGPDCRIRTWSVLLPQLQRVGSEGTWAATPDIAVPVRMRAWRVEGEKLKTIADPRDRIVAHVMTNTPVPRGTDSADIAAVNPELARWAADDRAVVLLYPIRPPGHTGVPVLGFECFIPFHPPVVGFRVHDPRDEAPVVLARPVS